MWSCDLYPFNVAIDFLGGIGWELGFYRAYTRHWVPLYFECIEIYIDNISLLRTHLKFFPGKSRGVRPMPK